MASGITVPESLGDFLVLDALYATRGTAVAVTDEALLAAGSLAARLEGTLVCPEGAVCFAAVRKLREHGWLSGTDEVVVLNTGTGLKYGAQIPVPATKTAAGPLPVTTPSAAET
ncbi:MAG: pyridoxal-phosphate dependent enzyme [Streptosporangiaceae bacterium]|nr:pyridoxal-phosphate dependent enzyme [Streptosporangiaceae bacterium]MBV9855202.1 pyridoxal-phosphate dependent enzyme [Streptosporangiaceae bacterium]